MKVYVFVCVCVCVVEKKPFCSSNHSMLLVDTLEALKLIQPVSQTGASFGTENEYWKGK